MPFSSCASTRQVSSSLMRRRVAEREDEADAVDIGPVNGSGGSRREGRLQTGCPGSGRIAQRRRGLVLYTAHPMPDSESFALYPRLVGQWGWARADVVLSWM